MRLRPFIRSASCAVALLAAGRAGAADLKLVITGASGPGQVYAKVFATAESLANNHPAVAALILTPADGQVSVTIGGLAPGRYAVAAFQDAKGTGKLESNLLGIPSVPYGFSNDAAGSMGPPNFDRAAVTLGADGATTTFRLR